MKNIEKVLLPKDNGPHDFIVEWWYFNGHLIGSDGNPYSFMDCFFKVDISKVKIPHLSSHLIEDIFKEGEYIHFSHSVISDISKKNNYKEIQDISLVSSDSFKKGLLYIKYKNAHILGGSLNGEIDEISPNNFNIKTDKLDLLLEPNKDPLFEGGHGYVGTPEDGSYYYSFTDLSVKGKINIQNKEIEVKGKAWMDHQWANASYKGKKDKWTWFSFQMDNNIEIMCVEYGRESSTDILIDIIDKNGKQTQYKKAEFTPLGKFWKSKKTKAKYPLSWKIEIPGSGITIKTEALLKDQEMIFGQINYWEGPMKVVMEIDGEKVKGKGFMELVGYPSDYNYLLLEGKDMENSLLKKIKKYLKIYH